jgi:hypothetical protein
MSVLRKHVDDGVVYRSDLELLQRVLNEACAERDLDPHSDEAEYLASFLIAIFQKGVTDEDEIKARLAHQP